MRRLGSALLAALTLTLALAATAQADIRLNPVRSLQAIEGELAPRDIIVVFDDDGACAEGAYTVTIRWGDGAESRGEIEQSDEVRDVNLNQMLCRYEASGRHTYAAPGSYPLSARVCRGTVCAESGAGGIATVAGAEIRGEAGQLRLNAGQPFSGAVAEFNDDNRSSRPADFSSVVDWGDGTTTPGVITGSDGRFTVSAQHTYGAPGTFPLNVRLLEGGTVVAAARPGVATVVAAGAGTPLTGSATPFRATVGTAFNRQLATFTDPSPLASLAGYQAVVEWGDGFVTQGSVGVAGAALAVGGGHTYDRAGSFTVRVTLQRPGAIGAVASSATVVAGARPGGLRLRGARTLSRRALRRGLPVRLSAPSSLRSLRVAVVRVGARPRTLGRVTVGFRSGGSVRDGVRTKDLRVKLSRSLLRRMGRGTYALQVRFAGSGTLRAQFRVR